MRSLVLPLLLAAAVGGLVWNQYRESGHERALGLIASEIAGRPVGVACQGLPTELVDVGWTAGEVRFDETGRPSDETRLDRQVCRDLARFREALSAPELACVLRGDPCERRAAELAYAPGLLAHEAWHLRGVVDEARTECYALQSTALVAERLGAAPEQAAAVAAWSYARVYPGLPARYRTGLCRDGGPLDLRPGSPAFP